jgi:hypothetical protein
MVFEPRKTITGQFYQGKIEDGKFQ